MQSFKAIALASMLVLASCDDSPPASTATPTPSASAPAPADTTDAPASGSSVPDMTNIKTLQDAIQSSLPLMQDTQETFSDGAQMLVLWAQDRLEWKDLAAIPSTKPALVMKDSENEMGKRICATGDIVEIAAQDVAGNVFVGELTDDDHIYRFIALRSTGDLVEQSNARFCGIVTGKVDYSNSVGGQSHAIQLVGMFDLPKNHQPVADD